MKFIFKCFDDAQKTPKHQCKILNIILELCMERINGDQVDRNELWQKSKDFLTNGSANFLSLLQKTHIGRKGNLKKEGVSCVIPARTIVYHHMINKGSSEKIISISARYHEEAKRLLDEQLNGNKRLRIKGRYGINWFVNLSDLKNILSQRELNGTEIRNLLGAPLEQPTEVIQIEFDKALFEFDKALANVSMYMPTIFDSNLHPYHQVKHLKDNWGQTCDATDLSKGLREIMTKNFGYPHEFKYKIYSKSPLKSLADNTLWEKRKGEIISLLKQQ